MVPYLTRDAVDAALRLVATVPDAGIAFDYPNPFDQLSHRGRTAHETHADRMRRIGEPWITYFDTDELAHHLGALGLTVAEDLGPAEIGVRWFGRSAEETTATWFRSPDSLGSEWAALACRRHATDAGPMDGHESG